MVCKYKTHKQTKKSKSEKQTSTSKNTTAKLEEPLTQSRKVMNVCCWFASVCVSQESWIIHTVRGIMSLYDSNDAFLSRAHNEHIIHIMFI